MDGGSVRFGEPGDFYKLSVANLSGNGTFVMEANFAQGRVDFLDVTGVASGSHQLAISSSGANPLADTSLHVVHIAGGDAQFALQGAMVDLGTYSYDLLRQGNDWFLDASTQTISPGTRSVLALFNAAPTVWYGELSTLRSRMGEVRMDGANAGGWVRVYGNKYNVSTRAGVGYQQTQQGFTLGADALVPFGDGQWLVGVMAGYSASDLDLKKGTSGTVDSYYAGAYTTWIDEPSGYYFDGVLKLNRFQNESRVSLSDGQRATGDYHNNGVGASLEFGRHIKLDDGYFIEPFTQWAAVVIQGKHYDLDNGMNAEGDSTRSLLGKLGSTAGRHFDVGEGRVIQPYIRAALVHEFAKSNEVKVNNNVFNNDLSGSRGELGAGVAMSVTDTWQVHADFDYSNGDKIEQPWGANVGVRYSW
jgi:outer membrane autotransporter protein